MEPRVIYLSTRQILPGWTLFLPIQNSVLSIATARYRVLQKETQDPIFSTSQICFSPRWLNIADIITNTTSLPVGYIRYRYYISGGCFGLCLVLRTKLRLLLGSVLSNHSWNTQQTICSGRDSTLDSYMQGKACTVYISSSSTYSFFFAASKSCI